MNGTCDEFFLFFAVSSLMRTGSGMSAAAAAGVSPMSGLSSEKQSAVSAAAMQFPLTQRRKRRVLFTQAQVSKVQDFYRLMLKAHGCSSI